MKETERLERMKAAFLTEYRQLCESHGFMVIRIENEGYTTWETAIIHPQVLDECIQEMLINKISEFPDDPYINKPEQEREK